MAGKQIAWQKAKSYFARSLSMNLLLLVQLHKRWYNQVINENFIQLCNKVFNDPSITPNTMEFTLQNGRARDLNP